MNNGGFGSWIGFHEPEVLLATVQALETVGATEMARLVAPVIDELGDLSRYRSADEWQDHFDSLPDDYHLRLERLSFHMPTRRRAIWKRCIDTRDSTGAKCAE